MQLSAELNTTVGLVQHWAEACPDRVWLRERAGDLRQQWTWQQARNESQAIAAWLESEYGTAGTRIGILSKNRAHWFLADLAVAASGHVSVPLFTTLTPDTVDYILNFSEVQLLILGQADNWEQVRGVVPANTRVLTLPGVKGPDDALRWEDVLAQYAGQNAKHVCRHDELMTIVFTSGTTGLPKGVMQTHDSMLVPMRRMPAAAGLRQHSRFLSYLPLSHIAERQLVAMNSLNLCGEVSFNENLTTLVRDMGETRPTFFFGAPRVWEMLRQGIVAKIGSQAAFDQAFESDPEAMGQKIRTLLGFGDYDYLLSAAAPIATSLLHWYERLGITLLEGFGQTEAMLLIMNTKEQRRTGSIGKPLAGVEYRLSEEGELLCKADACAPGYYKQAEKTAETFVDGWVHTGDKARVDEDGFIFLTGRVKDYFKTIHGKFVAPVPIEDAFAANKDVEQLCLLGRGYSKTVMVCVLSAQAQSKSAAELEASLCATATSVNAAAERHERIGAVITTTTPWTIENGVLTPTLKIKRDQVEARFGERAQQLAMTAAEQGELLVEHAQALPA